MSLNELRNKERMNHQTLCFVCLAETEIWNATGGIKVKFSLAVVLRKKRWHLEHWQYMASTKQFSFYLEWLIKIYKVWLNMQSFCNINLYFGKHTRYNSGCFTYVHVHRRFTIVTSTGSDWNKGEFMLRCVNFPWVQMQSLESPDTPSVLLCLPLLYHASCSSPVVVIIWTEARAVGLIDCVITTLWPSHLFPLAGHGNTEKMTHSGQSH